MNKYCYRIVALTFFLIGMCHLHAQEIAVKTNVLYWALGTPNLGAEIALKEDFSLDISGNYNLVSEIGNDVGLKHYSAQAELRYWPQKNFERHFFGIQGVFSDYNVKNIGLFKTMKGVRYDGVLYGGGLTYGYHWAFGNRLGIEASATAGYFRLKYHKYQTSANNYLGEYKAWYFGPTKVNLSFIYFLK